MDKRPIGIFDSGLGGLTVVREVKRLLPAENIVYFGDTARVPYGTKSKETVTRFSKENVKFLQRLKVKLIVVACNTASSLSLPALVRNFKIPIIGVTKPGVERALEVTKDGAVGVIGTRATVSSDIYKRLLRSERPSLKVVNRPCPLFVPLVEEGWLNNKITLKIVREYLNDFKRRNVKTLILGCTHYPLLKPAIKQVMGSSVELVDSAEETAKLVKKVLKKKDMLCPARRMNHHKFFVTDEPALFKKVGEMFLKDRITHIERV